MPLSFAICILPYYDASVELANTFLFIFGNDDQIINFQNINPGQRRDFEDIIESHNSPLPIEILKTKELATDCDGFNLYESIF